MYFEIKSLIIFDNTFFMQNSLLAYNLRLKKRRLEKIWDRSGISSDLDCLTTRQEQEVKLN